MLGEYSTMKHTPALALDEKLIRYTYPDSAEFTRKSLEMVLLNRATIFKNSVKNQI